ncbi:TPA: DNA gyrase subunit A, partial [Campylobacter coli]|nr:DNA gyrase subunit A [Campylobacter coli]
IIPTTDFDENKSLCFFTKNGIVKRTNLSEYQNIRSVGVKAINLDENDELVTAIIVQRDENEETGLLDDDSLNDENTNFDENLIESIKGKMLFAVTKKGMCIKFPLAKVREIGRVSRGVTAIKFKEKNDELVGAVVIENDEQEILSISAKGIGKRTNAGEYRLQSRGGKGVICMKLTDKTKELISVVIVDESMDLMALTSSGKMIRVDMQSIRKAGRNTSGVIVVNVENDEVVSIAKCPKEELEDEISDENLDLNL